MKPRNKFQAEIVALSKRLPKITATQQRWAEKNCFEHYARKTQKGIVSCLECGGEWTDKHLTTEKTVCPHCGMELTVKGTRAYKFKQVEYLCIVAKCADFQVLRFFYIESNTRKGEPAYYYFREVVQRWIAPNGKFATMAMLRPLFGFADYWQWSSELEIRPEKELYDIMPSCTYSRMNLLPQVKRNGFRGEFHNLTPFEMFHALLTENKAETLLKTGQTALLRYFIRKTSKSIGNYWNSINICTRNGYIVPYGSLWCDYIDLLRFFGKDTSSPKYVCPDDLHREHDRYVAKKQAHLERERLEQQRQKARDSEERFREMKAKYFGIAFTDGAIEVRVLESVDEFYEEGKSMRHCVFASEYYLRPDCLILSATIDGKRIETVEISLKTMKVVQSRGVCNKNTEYHDRIVKLVNKNKNLIRQRIAA